MTRTDLQDLAELRLREAQLLLEHGSPSGAYYLAGYTVECALKACIAKSTRQFEFPDKDRAIKSHSHKLRELINVANLESEWEQKRRADSVFRRFWSIVNDWSEVSRYSIWSSSRAQSMLEAVNSPEHGVLQWITTQW